MPYIFGKLWHLAIIWAIRKAFQCILQGVRILLAKYTRFSPTSENESYTNTFLAFSQPGQISVSVDCGGEIKILEIFIFVFGFCVEILRCVFCICVSGKQEASVNPG